MTGLVSNAVIVFQAAIVLAVLEGVRRRNLSAVGNGLLALGAALFPAILRTLLRWGPGVSLDFGPELSLWIAVAGLIHAVGMLGLYDTVWWWDHLAHTVSAALVTAIAYAAVIVASRAGSYAPVSSTAIVGTTVGLLLLFAVFWELIEVLARYVAERYDIGPFLVIYGPYDWAYDLAYNLVGAGLVLVLDLRVFVPVFEPFPLVTTYVLLGAGSVALVSVATLALFLGRVSNDWP